MRWDWLHCHWSPRYQLCISCSGTCMPSSSAYYLQGSKWCFCVEHNYGQLWRGIFPRITATQHNPWPTPECHWIAGSVACFYAKLCVNHYPLVSHAKYLFGNACAKHENCFTFIHPKIEVTFITNPPVNLVDYTIVPLDTSNCQRSTPSKWPIYVLLWPQIFVMELCKQVTYW